MIQTNYDYESGYHDGDIVEQDVRAFLGIFKRIEDVPSRYRLSNFHVDEEEAWNHFIENEGPESKHTRKHVYGTTYRRWTEFCTKRSVHPALPAPSHVEEWLSEEINEGGTLQSTYSTRCRPLYLWFRWMVYHTDYPHRYNPLLMACLHTGDAYDLWSQRLRDRENTPGGY